MLMRIRARPPSLDFIFQFSTREARLALRGVARDHVNSEGGLCRDYEGARRQVKTRGGEV